MSPRGATATKEPSTSLAPVRQASYPMFLENFDSMVNLCTMLAKSGKLGNIRTPESAIAVVLQAAELGIPPMAGFSNIYQINGKLGLSASLMQSLVMRDIPGVKFSFDEKPESCTVTLSRPGWDPYVSTFTLADAKKAGLIKPDSNWTKYPANMMRARALANACRTMAPEVLAGMYSPEELDENATITIAPPTSNGNGILSIPQDESSEQTEGSGVIDVESSPAVTAAAQLESEATEPEVVATETNGTHANGANGHTNGTNGTHAEPTPMPTKVEGPKASTPQLVELKRLMETLGLKDSRWKDTLAAYSVTTARDLTSDQAMHLIGVLRKRQTVAVGN